MEFTLRMVFVSLEFVKNYLMQSESSKISLVPYQKSDLARNKFRFA